LLASFEELLDRRRVTQHPVTADLLDAAGQFASVAGHLDRQEDERGQPAPSRLLEMGAQCGCGQMARILDDEREVGAHLFQRLGGLPCVAGLDQLMPGREK